MRIFGRKERQAKHILRIIIGTFTVSAVLAFSPPFETASSGLGKKRVSDHHHVVPLLIGHQSPDFTLTNTHGRAISIRRYQDRPVVLFFFCGCSWCHDCALQWGQFQHGGAIGDADASTLPFTQDKHFMQPISVIVFSGDTASAQNFAMEADLDPKQTVLLPDPDMRVTNKFFHDSVCPRVFVLGRHGMIQYTNDHNDDAPRRASALAITARALSALHSVTLQGHEGK